MQLTLKELKEATPHSIFRAGNAMIDGQFRRWVAVRGGIDDWVIYFGSLFDTDEHIRKYGDKLYSVDLIKKLVPCNSLKVLQKYRL